MAKGMDLTKVNLSTVYSVVIALVVVLSLVVASQFMAVSGEDKMQVIMQVLVNALIIVYIFFLAILAAVALGFAALFFKLDALEEQLTRGMAADEEALRRRGR
jgi:hypothetical protein